MRNEIIEKFLEKLKDTITNLHKYSSFNIEAFLNSEFPDLSLDDLEASEFYLMNTEEDMVGRIEEALDGILKEMVNEYIKE